MAQSSRAPVVKGRLCGKGLALGQAPLGAVTQELRLQLFVNLYAQARSRTAASSERLRNAPGSEGLPGSATIYDGVPGKEGTKQVSI